MFKFLSALTKENNFNIEVLNLLDGIYEKNALCSAYFVSFAQSNA